MENNILLLTNFDFAAKCSLVVAESGCSKGVKFQLQLDVEVKTSR